MTPDPAIDNLIEDIRIRAMNGPITEFEFAMFRKRAHKMMNADPAQAHSALGILAAEAGDEVESRKNHKKATELSSATQFIFNYGASLGVLGHHGEAINTMLKAIEIDKTNLAFLNHVIWIMHGTEDTRLPETLTLWEELTNGEPHPVVEQIEHELSSFCMISSQPALVEIWDNPEEDEAWKHLQ